MNNVNLIGRITTDLTLRTGNTGTKYVFFTVAINEYRGGKETVDFIPCVAFERVAENMANHLGKGSLIGVTGHISVKSTQTDEKYETRIHVNASRIQFLDNKRKNEIAINNDSESSSTDQNEITNNDQNINDHIDDSILWD